MSTETIPIEGQTLGEARHRAYERMDIENRTMEMPDKSRVYINAENEGEVMITVTRPDGGRELKTLSRSDFDALVDQYEASVSAESADGNSVTEDSPGEDAAIQEEAQPAEVAENAEEPEDFDTVFSRLSKNLWGTGQSGEGEPEPQPKNSENPTDGEEEGRTTVPPEQEGEPKQSLDELQTRLAAARQEYGRLTDKSNQRAQELRAEIRLLHDQVMNFNGQEASEEAPEPEGGTEDLEEIEARIAAARQEYGRLADKTTSHALELRREINSLHAQLIALGEQSAEPKKPSPEDNPDSISRTVKEAMAEEERKRHRQDVLNTIDTELNAEYGEQKKSAMDRYAKAMADVETKGGMFNFGKQKRLVALKEAEDALRQVELSYAEARAEKRKAADLYEGDEQLVKQAMGSDMFAYLKTLDPRSRQAKVDERLKREAERGPVARFAANVGKWLNKGHSGWKAAGAGFGEGLAGSFVRPFMTVGFPVTALATAAGAWGIGEVTFKARLDKSLRDQIGEQGKVKDGVLFSPEQYQAFMAEMKRSGIQDNNQVADRMVGRIFNASREAGDKERTTAKRQSRRTMGRFALGAAAGSIVGNVAHMAWDSARAASTSHINAPDNHTGGGGGETGSGGETGGGGGELETLKSIKGLEGYAHAGDGGNHLVGQFLHANGYNMSESDVAKIWDSVTHNTSTDIFSDNGAVADTYRMTGKFAGHAGVSDVGEFVWNENTAQKMLDMAKTLSGK